MNRAIGFVIGFLPVLVPGMLVAQTLPQTAFQASAPVAMHATLIAASPLPSPMEGAAPNRISSGLILPRLIHTAPIIEPGHHLHLTAKKLVVVVEYTVDETGTPQHPKIVESANWVVDGEVLAAVTHFQYRPGLLDGQIIPFPMRLRYILDKGAEY